MSNVLQDAEEIAETAFNFATDPLNETTEFAERTFQEVKEFGETLDPAIERVARATTVLAGRAENETPNRSDTIPLILGEQLKELRRRRGDRTLTSGPGGAADTPLATTTLFGE